MSFTYDPSRRSAAQLTALARAAATTFISQFGLSTYLPEEDTPGLTYDIDKNVLGLTDAAPFRAFDTSAPLGRTFGTERASGQIPPISKKQRVTEFEQLALQIDSEEAIGNKFDDYARGLGRSIAARAILAQAEAIQTGKLTLDEGGLKLGIDYGRDEDLTAALAQKISNPDAPILDPLLSAMDVYATFNGGRPGIGLVSSMILQPLTRNKEIIGLAVGRGSDLPSRISIDDVLSVLTSFGVPRLRVFEEKIDNVPLLDPTKIAFLPDNGGIVDGGALGKTLWGIPAEAIQPLYGITGTDRPGIFAAAFHGNDPEGHFILASSVVVPAVTNANAVMTLDVL